MTAYGRGIWVWMPLLTAGMLAGPGCIRRTVTINTVPEGARIALNDEEIGTSPITVDFTWYGDYDVIVRHEGYETLKTHHKIKAPWYELPPIDFVTEALIPFTVTDRREMSFTLEPQKPVDTGQLVKEATQFRDRTLFGSE